MPSTSFVLDLEEWEVFGILRRRAGLSQLEISRYTGIPQPKISNWERRGVDLRPERVQMVWAALNHLDDDDVVVA